MARGHVRCFGIFNTEPHWHGSPFSFWDATASDSRCWDLAAGVGTALAGALLGGVLSTSIHRELVHNPLIPKSLQIELNLNNVPLLSNDQLLNALARTSATPEETSEALNINKASRLVALKVSFFTLAGFALLAFFPAGGLPDYIRGEVPGSNPASWEQSRQGPIAVSDP